MKIAFAKRVANIALALVLSASIWTPYANAYDYDLRQVLVGKWHQQTGRMVSEMVYQPNGRFTGLARTAGTNLYFYSEGTWEIRNGNILVQHNLNWSPKTLHHVDGTESPLIVPEWEHTQVQVVDNDHVRNQFGVAYLMK